MTLFDTHTHVNFQPFQADAEAVIERARAQNIILNNVGTQWESSQRSVQLAEQYANGVWASVGLHPIHLFQDMVEQQTIGTTVQRIRTRAEQFNYQRYKQLAQSSDKVVAIGECGLDYYHGSQLRKVQYDTLEQHCALALELDLPLVIHCRNAAIHTADTMTAFHDLLVLVHKYKGQLRGVVHCYTGMPELIAQFLELGFYIGFTGIVTFPKATIVHQAVQAVPLNRLLLETDAPYLTPVPHRGQRNEPMYLRYVAEGIAKLKHETVQRVAAQTTANAVELFRLS